MSSWTRWTDDFLKNNVRNLIDISDTKQNKNLLLAFTLFIPLDRLAAAGLVGRSG
jgi:hypothetical protein